MSDLSGGDGSGVSTRPGHVVVGQRTEPEILGRAKELRREMTAAESRLWAALRANRLGGLHFRRQQVIDGFIVDFYCHRAGVAVEVDGGIHRFQASRDSERDAVLATRGVAVLRVSNQSVLEDLPGVLGIIARAAELRMRTSTIGSEAECGG